MATATKTERAVVTSQACAAGATITGTLALTTALGGQGVARVTNGGTGPTIGCTVYVYQTMNSVDYLVSQQQVGVAAGTTYDVPFSVPVGLRALKVVFTGNTVQAVTVSCYFDELTSIG